MKSAYDRSNCIQKAAAMVMGHRYSALQYLCDNQKTVNTKVLERELDRLRDESKLDGIFLREVSKLLLSDEMKTALLDAKAVAMKNTIAARIPECGDFGGIAQNLAYVCEQLGIEEN